MAKLQSVNSASCTPRSSADVDSECGLRRADSNSSAFTTCEPSAQKDRAATPDNSGTYRVAYAAEPLPASSLTYLWCIVTHLLLTFFPYVGIGLLVGALYSRVCTYVCGILLGTLLLPRSPHSQAVIDVLDRIIFIHWRRAIQLKVVQPVGLDLDQQYLLAGFPHGAFPLATQLHASMWTQVSTRTLKILSASVLFRVPVWRHYMSVGGCIPASRALLKKTLKDGHSPVVLVGGIAEMFMLDQDRERIMLQKRKGFVRAALEAGVPILPVYYFGQSRLMSFGPKALSGVSRHFRTSMGIVYGPWGLPMPRKMPITAVVGQPVPVPKVSRDSPDFEQQVEAVHDQYVAAIKQLYTDHQADYHDGCQSWQNRPLEVV